MTEKEQNLATQNVSLAQKTTRQVIWIKHDKDDAGYSLPGGPVVKTLSSNAGAQVRSLVKELRSHMLHGEAKKKKKDARNTLQWKHTGRTRQNHKDCMEEDLQGEAQN